MQLSESTRRRSYLTRARMDSAGPEIASARSFRRGLLSALERAQATTNTPIMGNTVSLGIL